MNLYDAMDKCPEDWHDVFVKTANVLVKTYKNKISGTVFFHRGSTFMKKIYEAKAQVMARQIIKRAERIAEKKESSKIDELQKLLEIAVLGAQGLLKPSDQAVLGPKKPPNA